MLFTQWNLDDALEVRYEEGLEDGRMLNLIQQVRKKLQKGKSLVQIADEVEEPLDLVEKINQSIKDCDTTDDVKKIYDHLLRLL